MRPEHPYVSQAFKAGHWRAQGKIDGDFVYLGSRFTTDVEAARAWDDALGTLGAPCVIGVFDTVFLPRLALVA